MERIIKNVDPKYLPKNVGKDYLKQNKNFEDLKEDIFEPYEQDFFEVDEPVEKKKVLKDCDIFHMGNDLNKELKTKMSNKSNTNVKKRRRKRTVGSDPGKNAKLSKSKRKQLDKLSKCDYSISNNSGNKREKLDKFIEKQRKGHPVS